MKIIVSKKDTLNQEEEIDDFIKTPEQFLNELFLKEFNSTPSQNNIDMNFFSGGSDTKNELDIFNKLSEQSSEKIKSSNKNEKNSYPQTFDINSTVRNNEFDHLINSDPVHDTDDVLNKDKQFAETNTIDNQEPVVNIEANNDNYKAEMKDSNSINIDQNVNETNVELTLPSETENILNSTDNNIDKIDNSIPVTEKKENVLEDHMINNENNNILNPFPVKDETKNQFPINSETENVLNPFPIKDEIGNQFPLNTEIENVLNPFPIKDEIENQFPINTETENVLNPFPVNTEVQNAVNQFPVTINSQNELNSFPLNTDSQNILDSFQVKTENKNVLNHLPVDTITNDLNSNKNEPENLINSNTANELNSNLNSLPFDSEHIDVSPFPIDSNQSDKNPLPINTEQKDINPLPINTEQNDDTKQSTSMQNDIYQSNNNNNNIYNSINTDITGNIVSNVDDQETKDKKDESTISYDDKQNNIISVINDTLFENTNKKDELNFFDQVNSDANNNWSFDDSFSEDKSGWNFTTPNMPSINESNQNTPISSPPKKESSGWNFRTSTPLNDINSQNISSTTSTPAPNKEQSGWNFNMPSVGISNQSTPVNTPAQKEQNDNKFNNVSTQNEPQKISNTETGWNFNMPSLDFNNQTTPPSISWDQSNNNTSNQTQQQQQQNNNTSGWNFSMPMPNASSMNVSSPQASNMNQNDWNFTDDIIPNKQMSPKQLSPELPELPATSSNINDIFVKDNDNKNQSKSTEQNQN